MSLAQAEPYPTKPAALHPETWQTASFSLALIIYALTGSPTPDSLGVSEILTAVLLLLAFRVPVITLLSPSAALFLLYGLTIPLIIGAASGHAAGVILRDLIPFGFLLLPLFYQGGRNLALLLTFVGLSFAVRAVLPYFDTLNNPQLWFGQPPADLLYLANSPEVLFSCLLLLGSGCVTIWAGRGFLKGTGMILLALIPLIAMAVMMQRASFASILLAGMIWGAMGLWRRPVRMLPLIGLALALMIPLYPILSAFTDTLVLKTELVGLNSRAQEWSKVFDLLGQSPLTWLFGLGWGTTFENPAVGNITVNYTHSLISALLLKTGVIGLMLGVSYLWILAKQAVPELFRRPVLMVALAAPLGIGALFYASYKSLGFGLVLLLLANSALHRKLEKNQ